MNKESFIKIFKEIEKLEEIYETLYSINIDIAESEIYLIPHNIFEEFIRSSFTDETTQDFIFWWMYEASECDKIMEDENGNEIDVSTVEGLWDYLTSNEEAVSNNS